MPKEEHRARALKAYSDNLFSLLGELSGEVANLPEELRKNLNSVAERLLEEVYAQAEFERTIPVTPRLQ